MATETKQIWESHYLAFVPTNKKWYEFWKPKYRQEWWHYSKWPENALAFKKYL